MIPLPDPYKAAVRRWVVDESLTDDVIGNRIIGTFDARPLREQAWEYVNELRAEQVVPGRPLTDYQAAKIPELQAEAARLRRNTTRGVSDAALSRRTGVDRATIAAWRKAGILKV